MTRKEEFRVGGAEQGHGWSELPGELLTLIEQRYLIQLKHAIRFRAVCKPWRKTLAELQPIMFRQSFSSPLLMLPYCNEDDHKNEGCGSQELQGWQCRRLLDLAHSQYYHIDFVQGFEKTNCRGSGFGWLFMLQLPAPVLLNPLTGKQISLPPFTSLPDVLQYNPERVGGEFVLQHPDGDKVRVGNRRLGLNFLRVVAMSADPTTSEEDCTLMAIRTNEGRDLVFCKPGGDRWTLIPDPERISASCNSIVFWRNRFHVVDCHGNVLRCDIDNPAAPTISCLVAGVSIASPFTYLVVGPDDELIMVIKSMRYEFDDEDAPPAAECGYGLRGHHREDAGHHEDVGHHEAAYHNEDVGGDEDHHGDVGHHEAAYHNEDVGDDDDHPEDVVGDHDDDQDSILDFTDGELDGEADLESYWSQGFLVCRLNEDTYRWDRVQSLGDFALFLGSNASSCVSTRDYPGLKSNCIYFTDDYIAKHVPGRLGGHDMGIFHLSDGTVEPFCCNGLYKPSLIWPPPVWILP